MGTPDRSATAVLATRVLLVLLILATLTAQSVIVYNAVLKKPVEPLPFTAARAPDHFLVKFVPGTPAERVSSVNSAAGVHQIGEVPRIGVKLLSVAPGKTPEEMIAIYTRNPNVEFAEPDYVQTAQLTPNDPYFSKDVTAFSKIAVPTAWDLSTGSSAVTIAIIDTGVDYNHPDFAGRIVGGYDFVNGDADPMDDNGHGTLAAGIAAATGNNAQGVAGLDWKAAVMPVKVLDASASGNDSTVSQGIVYAVDNGASVLNLSLGAPVGSATMQAAVEYAASLGCVMTAAAGNFGLPGVYFPAAYPQVIAVGALNGDVIAATSCFGPEIDVAAPGVGIYSTAVGGSYAYFSGTSAAAPFAAGAAALVLASAGDASPDTVKAAITSAATDLGVSGFDEYYGWGRINVEAALRAVGAGAPSGGTAPPPDTAPPTVSLTYPTAGSTVSGTVALMAGASDASGVTRVIFYVDGSAIGTSTASPYTASWTTTKYSTGTHTVVAQAWDAAGNHAESQASVTVSNTTTRKKR